MRTGELLSLWVEQFHLGHEPSVSVRRNHDDVHDPRAYQPTSKTKERILPISDELAKLVQHYILEVRARIPGARRHPYVFVSHKAGKTFGRPLSKNGLYRVIERVSAVSPELAGIHPHALRHHMNYALSLAIDQHNAASRSNDAEQIIRRVASRTFVHTSMDIATRSRARSITSVISVNRPTRPCDCLAAHLLAITIRRWVMKASAKANAAVPETASPRMAISKDGYSFDPKDMQWKLNKDVQISLGVIDDLEPDCRQGARLTLQRYAEEQSASHTYNMAERMKRFIRETGLLKCLRLRS